MNSCMYLISNNCIPIVFFQENSLENIALNFLSPVNDSGLPYNKINVLYTFNISRSFVLRSPK